MKFYLNRNDIADPVNVEKEFEIDGYFSDSPSNSIAGDYVIDNMDILLNEKIIGRRMLIETPEQMQAILQEDLQELQVILIETADWHIIPIENLIAKLAELDTELIATASTPEEVTLLENILELGVDGCLLEQSSSYTIQELLQSISADEDGLDLVPLQVTSTQKIGNGDRVCVDTVSMLRLGEGLLVGSTSAVQVLVQAEVEKSGFVNSRPFRVNAGVVSSYTLNFEKTNYLSELSAGDTVMIVDRQGHVRKEHIARVKIERRPLIVVKCEYKSREYAVILQDAETVKVITPHGSKRVDRLEIGDEVLCHISTGARHFGMKIDEFIEEK